MLAGPNNLGTISKEQAETTMRAALHLFPSGRITPIGEETPIDKQAVAEMERTLNQLQSWLQAAASKEKTVLTRQFGRLRKFHASAHLENCGYPTAHSQLMGKELKTTFDVRILQGLLRGSIVVASAQVATAKMLLLERARREGAPTFERNALLGWELQQSRKAGPELRNGMTKDELNRAGMTQADVEAVLKARQLKAAQQPPVQVIEPGPPEDDEPEIINFLALAGKLASPQFVGPDQFNPERYELSDFQDFYRAVGPLYYGSVLFALGHELGHAAIGRELPECAGGTDSLCCKNRADQEVKVDSYAAAVLELAGYGKGGPSVLEWAAMMVPPLWAVEVVTSQIRGLPDERIDWTAYDIFFRYSYVRADLGTGCGYPQPEVRRATAQAAASDAIDAMRPRRGKQPRVEE